MENTLDIAHSRDDVLKLLKVAHGRGRDGRDVAKGALMAVRAFIRENIGPERTEPEFEMIVAELKRMGD